MLINLIYLITDSMNFKKFTFFMLLLCPKILTFSAPATLPKKPISIGSIFNNEYNEEITKKASPAPNVSTTLFVNAGI